MSRVHDADGFVSLEREIGTAFSTTPLEDDTDPLIPRAQQIIDDENDRIKRANAYPDTYLHVAEVTRPLRKATSDLTLRAKTRECGLSEEPFETTIGVVEAANRDLRSASPYQASVSLQLPRRYFRRSSSNSRIESQSRYHDPSIDSATLQKHLIDHIRHNGQIPHKPTAVRWARTSNGPFGWQDPRSPRPGFKWFPIRSKSASASLYQTARDPHRCAKNLPLKSSLKRKSKSAAATPPSGTTTDPGSPVKSQLLRRVKTVDFEDAISRRLIALPPLKLLPSESSRDIKLDAQPKSHTNKKKGPKPLEAKKSTSFRHPATKSKIADPAVTRTDVHVVAIAPCWNSEDAFDESGIDPATPTMQIVESKGGCFEVIWDDLPVESDVRERRRSSSASQTLNAIGSTASRGLERVNSKLIEWTFGSEDQQPFKTQVVVFPDSDSRTNVADNAVYDDEDAAIIAPPNSERTSATQSRFPSRWTSARPSRTASHDESIPLMSSNRAESPNERAKEPEVVLTLPSPDSGASSWTLASNGRRVEQVPTFRRLSNIEEADLKFRGHRDSVTLAHTRIIRSGGVSPELFTRRDSVSVAKKRMHMRNHAVSEARTIPRRAPASSQAHLTIGTRSGSPDMPSPPTVKEHATKALKSTSSASMLRPQPTSKRHIRIVEG